MPAVAEDDLLPVCEAHFYGSVEIARLLDTPCRGCAKDGVEPDEPCKTGSRFCDRWTTDRARRWMLSTKAGVKRGRRIVTTRERLREHFPELWDLIVLRTEREDD